MFRWFLDMVYDWIYPTPELLSEEDAVELMDAIYDELRDDNH